MLPELTMMDYLNKPLTELVEYPDFSEKAMAVAMRLSVLTTTQLMDYDEGDI